MKPDRPNRRLPGLHMTAHEFERLQAVADRAGVNMALFAKRAVMRAVSRQEAFARLSAPSDTGPAPERAPGPGNGPGRPLP